MDFILTGK